MYVWMYLYMYVLSSKFVYDEMVYQMVKGNDLIKKYKDKVISRYVFSYNCVFFHMYTYMYIYVMYIFVCIYVYTYMCTYIY
jgi:hypothetical protein